MPHPMLSRKAFLILLSLLMTCSGLRAVERKTCSVLSSGEWRKVSVTESGIYCLTNEDLAIMGFSDPSSVRVYGAGGRQLSLAAGADLRDDLYLLPAVHTGRGVLFYAEGPVAWASAGDSFAPLLNAYSRKAYYYVTTGSADDTPRQAAAPELEASSPSISSYDNRFLYATCKTNIGGTGRAWFSDVLKSGSSSVQIPVSLRCSAGAVVKVSGTLAAQASSATSFTVTADGAEVASASVPALANSLAIYSPKTFSASFTSASSSVSDVRVSASINSSASTAYVGHLALVADAPLAMDGPELLFRSHAQREASGGAALFSVSGAESDVRVWDVTTPWKPEECHVTWSDGKAVVPVFAGAVGEFVAFSPSGEFPSPDYEGSVSRHNLHSHASVNYLVVTSADFKEYADRLCALHSDRQSLSTRVVMVDDIYDEFSAGRAEAPAIRDYIKMLYDRGGGTSDELKYVLLLGAGSYDNYDRSLQQNVIPTYQSEASTTLINSYCTDDFFGWLEEGDGVSDLSSTVRVGIGRVPCSTTAMAEAYVAKAESYVLTPVQGDWRSKAVFVGQSGDGNEHVSFAERQSSAFEEENPDMDVNRIYSESFTRVVSSTGASYPQAVAKSLSLLQGGCSLYHFTGHGGANSVGEGYFSREIASSLTNGGKACLLVAATCQLAPFDAVSGNCSEDVIFNPQGGAIAAFAATRETYGTPNYLITRNFDKYVYSKDDAGGPNTFGYAVMKAKQTTARSVNALKYVLLGDPALAISVPVDLYVSLDSVNGVAPSEMTLPVKALEYSTVKCSVRRNDGSVDDTFSGSAVLSIYDKRVTRQTSGEASGTPFSYEERGARIFSGQVEVVNGLLEASFILSKEFDLSVGYGRLSAYASATDGRDAMGSSDEVLIGGFADGAISDEEGPDIVAWIDYKRDDNGDILSSTPYLYAIISDEQGVNLSGQGVGHDISLVINSDRTSAVPLNDYFAYDMGSHTSGMLSYPLTSAPESYTSLTIKAWDNLNNSSSVTIGADFSPSGSLIVDAKAVYSQGCVGVSFSSAAPAGAVRVSTSVYTLSGVLVGRSDEDGLLRNGSGKTLTHVAVGPLAEGVYIVRCEASAAGKYSSFTKKIIVKAQ